MIKQALGIIVARTALLARGLDQRLARCPSVATLAIALLGFASGAHAQELANSPGRDSTVVRGLYNWVHTTANAERSFAFYRDVFGIELAPSPFVASPSGAPEQIRSSAEARSDPLVWDLTDTKGSRFRTVFMRASNTSFGLELSEFFDIARSERAPNPWDKGSSRLIFEVRDLDGVIAKLGAAGARIVTLGGAPIETTRGRALLARNPEGYLVEVRQADAAAIGAAAPGPIIATSIGITVADLSTALAFYAGLLRLPVGESRRASNAELRLNGLAEGELSQTTVTIPGVDAALVLSEFELPATMSEPAETLRWRIQDVAAPQFQLEVVDLEGLLVRTRAAGYGFLSVGGRPIQRPFGRFVFAMDPDSVLVEFVEPGVR
jgi:catechol 2,3-dioxygenase-like lactoylglutathione lyase family enzyme